MPSSRWEASQRPLFVRTVWVSGARHAILTPDDPARRLKRFKKRTYSAASVPKRKLVEPLEDCLSNKSLESPKAERFSERIYQWLESTGKIRPPTPFEGALWENVKEESLDIASESVRIVPKQVDLELICSGVSKPPLSPSPPPTPPLVQTFCKRRNERRIPTSSTRPQLHIFMPLVFTRQSSDPYSDAQLIKINE